MSEHKKIHDLLIVNYNNIQLPIEAYLKELEDKRAGVHDSHRARLEENIGKQKDILKAIKEQELNLRLLFK